jgi:hypothetical protein
MEGQPLDGLQSGGGYASAVNGIIGMVSAIGGGIAADRYAPPPTIRHDDVVVEETQADSRVLIVTVVACILLVLTIVQLSR